VTRWTRRLLFGAVAVLVPVLAGCEAGLNAPTLEYHPASNGAQTVQRGITISNLFVLGPRLNASLPSGGRAGVFFAVSAEHQDRLISVSAPGTAASVKLTGGPVALPPGAPVLLTGPEPEVVFVDLRKPLAGGQDVRLVFTFVKAGSVSVQAPVLSRAYEYATFSPPATGRPKATSTPRASGSSSPAPTASASQGGGQPTSTPTPSSTP
jgi:copper(I)-binding protein